MVIYEVYELSKTGKRHLLESFHTLEEAENFGNELANSCSLYWRRMFTIVTHIIPEFTDFTEDDFTVFANEDFEDFEDFNNFD